MRGHADRDRSKDKGLDKGLDKASQEAIITRLRAEKRDVLSTPALLTEDIAHLNRVWKLDGSDPLHGLLMWRPDPEDQGEKVLRRYLLDFAARIILHERRRAAEAGSKGEPHGLPEGAR